MSILEQLKNKGRKLLAEVEAKQVLADAGVPVNRTCLAHSREEAVELAGELGFPVALKIVSPDVLHKTDAGGVALNLAGAGEVGRAYDEIMAATLKKCPQARIDGISVQKMIAAGTEVIIGMTRDPQFGPMLMFGLGGIFVEVLKDVSFRIVPLTLTDARDMLTEIKGYPLLMGFRGAPPADTGALAEVLVRLSDFIERHPEIEELDINPLFAGKEGVIAADARMVLNWDADV